MRKPSWPGIFTASLLAISGYSLAQSRHILSGTWQGTLSGDPKLRVVLEISPQKDGSLRAALFSIDQSLDEIPATSVKMDKSTLRASFSTLQATFTAQLGPDSETLNGNWVQGDTTPLSLKHVSGTAQWRQFHGTVSSVPVEKHVQLEVIDWGGNGQPLIFLAGLGNTAHIFDQFAPQFTKHYHVYGITRRGFGFSSSPPPDESNYSADRLADDDLTVMKRLNIQKPVLVGHSIAGEELSSIAARYPSKIAALIYLEAGYAYACYDQDLGNTDLDAIEVERQIDQLLPGSDVAPLVANRQLLSELPRLQKDLEKQQAYFLALRNPPEAIRAPSLATSAVWRGQQRYTRISVPALAIFAVPHDNQGSDEPTKTRDLEKTTTQSEAFRRCAPQAKVIKIPNANHYIFLSNEAEVVASMGTFLAGITEAHSVVPGHGPIGIEAPQRTLELSK